MAFIQESDFEAEVRIKDCGILAGSWDARAYFFVKAGLEEAGADKGSR